MKKAILFFFIYSISNILFAQEKRIQSEIESVKVFFQGAEVTRKAITSIPKGTSLLILEGISKEIIPSSIQVMPGSSLSILTVEYKGTDSGSDFVRPKNAKILQLEDSIEHLRDKISLLEIRNISIKKEHEILTSVKFFSNPNTGLNINELEKFMELNRIRTLNIHTEKYQNEKSIVKTQNSIEMLNKKINNEYEKMEDVKLKSQNADLSEIRILVYSSKAITGFGFSFSYVAKAAGWIPLYDIKSEGFGKKSFLVYKAEVAQHTGENWDNVKLSLSSSNTSLGINIPVLEPLYLGFTPKYTATVEGIYKKHSSLNYANVVTPLSLSEIPTFDMNRGVVKETSLSLQSRVLSSEILIEFEIEFPLSIPNTGQGSVVNVKEYEIPVNYQYYAVPKKEKAVFLTGSITDWQKLNILPAFANMFFKHNYTGKTFVNPNLDNDTLRFSFGRDSRILIERKNVKDFAKSSLFGSMKRETFNYEIIITNTYEHSISMILIDQIPVSKQELIVVETTKFSMKPQSMDDNGRLEWELNLKPKETLKINVAYSVTSPKGKLVY